MRETSIDSPATWRAETLLDNDGLIELDANCQAEIDLAAAELAVNPLPVEVLQFGFETTRTLIRRALQTLDLGGHDVMQRLKGSDPWVTDEGNVILDLHLAAIPDAVGLARALSAIPGVVEHGLFLGMCDLAIIGKSDGTVVELDRDEGIDADLLAGEGD